jgi:NAD(P)-dependent dehydrogenase (short-subunit alcohol dehydrogenase family)
VLNEIGAFYAECGLQIPALLARASTEVTVEGTKEENMILKDKVAIVTGGSQGIGRAIAIAFAAEGAAVVVAARNLSKLQETVAAIKLKGGRAKAVQTDLSDEKQIEHMVAETIKEYGRIDVLVNNSGVAGPTVSVVDMDLNQWNEALAVNLTGAMLAAKHVLKHMIPQRSGTIINIGSERGRTGDGKSGSPMRTSYSCSKAGMVALTESLSTEVGQYNIRVNCVTAAAVRGERIINVFKAQAEASGVPLEDLISKMVENYSLKRPVEPEEVAAAVIFLASDAASGITGQTLPVSCGQSIIF